MRILTFNWHEPYLCLMAEIGHEFFVLEPPLVGDARRKWDFRFRPLPKNMKVVSEREMVEKLDQGFFNLIVCQNVRDFFLTSKWAGVPKILVFHNKLTTELALDGDKTSKSAYLERIRPVVSRTYSVFISGSKRDDWGFPGDVIPPGIPVEDYGGYEGNSATVLRVGNRLAERDLMMGFSAQNAVCRGLPSVVLGDNPSISGSRTSESWDDLRGHYRKCRVYLNATTHPYEDGYNLSMLEAMATGMPVVSLANPESPLTDGEDGFVSPGVEKLRACAKLLLEDRVLARKMGEKGRMTVEKKFPMEPFISRWNEAIDNAMAGKPARPRACAGKRAGVWIDYAYYPATTAHYVRRAFAEKYDVVASGPSISEETIKLWKLENMRAPVLPQDITRTAAPDAPSAFARMPDWFEPEFFLWIETGLDLPPAGLERIPIPKAAYLIDTHLHLEDHVRIAKMFDCVFLAQRRYIRDFTDAGVRNVFWLPLGCDPRIHGKRNRPKTCDVGFAGTLSDDAHKRRNVLLGRLAERFKVRVERLFLEEMAEMYYASKIVFNNAVRNDLNMRVFEGLCSGSLLLTDGADGLSDLFEDGRHLVVYNDDNMIEKAGYYLEHDAERELIAKAGMELALERHTYLHRVEEMASRMKSLFGAGRPRAGGQYFQNERSDVMGLVPDGAVRILDVGCAAGVLGGALKRHNPKREVVGLECDIRAAQEAGGVLDKVFRADAERFWPPYPEHYFDCIIYADVLEHLTDPLAALKMHKRFLAPHGVMVMSIPNVRHFSVVQGLLEGRWKYQAEGLLDKTHLRFFTLAEIREMLDEAGLEPISIQGKRVDDVYKDGASGTLTIGRAEIKGLSAVEMAEFFFFQYLVVAAPKKSSAEEGAAPAKLRPVSETTSPQMPAETFRNPSTNAPESVGKYLDELAATVVKSAVMFRTADEAEANSRFVECIDGLRAFVGIIDKIRSPNGPDFANMTHDSKPAGNREEALLKALDSIHETQTRKDWVSLADMLEFELAPLVLEWKGVLCLYEEP
ncbi:MAG: glycosyltransferase [Nitrospinae bacterium]|nr:glycosyltransferase [Nitrospinota bacterium]